MVGNSCFLIFSPKYAVEPGDVTVYAMNLNSRSPVRIATPFNSSLILAYNLEPADGTLTSSLVINNGKVLQLDDAKNLPEILPRWTKQIELKPLTFGFFVMVDAGAEACI